VGAFNLKSAYKPCGDQPVAIEKLLTNFKDHQEQVLLGVTGSGKTFTMANIIQGLSKKTLILAHNKTLAAQLYAEFKEFFPDNAVEYFVSYYDYYQPEAYIPSKDAFIEKDSAINDEIDKLRHRATRSLLERDDVIIIASVSCIYGIGSPEEYRDQRITLFKGDKLDRDDFLKKLIAIQYERNDIDFSRGHFRVRGDIVEVFPSHEESQVVRVEFFGDEIDALSMVDPLRGKVLTTLNRTVIYPKSHYVVGRETLLTAIEAIKLELRERLVQLKDENKLVEYQRLSQRTLYDLEMMEEMGYCKGIENYSRHLTGAKIGEPPPTLVDFFGDDFLLIVDESHMTLPQVRGMYRGDRARKETLVNYGFRLPCALDNRPLMFEEFEDKLSTVLYVSATPADYELEATKGEYVEQIIRPTGLLDPIIEVHDAANQVDHLLVESRKVIKEGFRVLVTTLTKKLAEELTDFFKGAGLKVKYLHSDIDTLERMEILHDLRKGLFDVLVGINLLREGLDLPEVALVAILDADKEGFLRSERSLIQTIGRAARNEQGRVLLYAYRETESMRKAISETKRRRQIQHEYNEKNGITPMTIKKGISGGVIETLRGNKEKNATRKKNQVATTLTYDQIETQISLLTAEMKRAAKSQNFEDAIHLREEIAQLKELRMMM